MRSVRFHSGLMTLSLLAISQTTVMSQAVVTQKMWDLPTHSSAVDRAVSADNLRNVMQTNSDPDMLLGLAFVARAGDPVRQEIAAKVVAARAEYASITTLLALAMDGVTPELVAELIQRDPNNALGHYLNGTVLQYARRTNDALNAFTTGAACSELRLYRSTLGDALLKALDALNLKGRDRLAALTWIEARWSNFGLGRLQYLNISALESVLSGAGDNRAEVSELLIGMAGHFSALESGPMFSLRPLLQAFRLKAELAGQQRSPTMHSYAAVAQALAGVMVGGDTVIQDTAGVDRSKLRNAQHAARYLPSRISHAIWITGDADAYRGLQRFAQVPGRYVSRTINAAHSLVDLALADPEGIVMPYLRGRVAESTNPRGPWVTTLTAVEEFVIKKPDVFRAALEFEEARSELEQVAMRDNWSEYSRRLALHWTLVTLAACCGVLLLYRLARKCWRGSVSVSRGA